MTTITTAKRQQQRAKRTIKAGMENQRPKCIAKEQRPSPRKIEKSELTTQQWLDNTCSIGAKQATITTSLQLCCQWRRRHGSHPGQVSSSPHCLAC
eukprot:m.264860 g.264860  ORF g.264860 m.264860 type:complete len:96 (-) comp59318_c0_seq1:53-340(-)